MPQILPHSNAHDHVLGHRSGVRSGVSGHPDECRRHVPLRHQGRRKFQKCKFHTPSQHQHRRTFHTQHFVVLKDVSKKLIVVVVVVVVNVTKMNTNSIDSALTFTGGVKKQIITDRLILTRLY